MFIITYNQQLKEHFKSLFKQSLTGLNSEFSISKPGYHIKFKELSLPYYSSIAGERIVGCVPFPKVLAQFKMQTRF